MIDGILIADQLSQRYFRCDFFALTDSEKLAVLAIASTIDAHHFVGIILAMMHALGCLSDEAVAREKRIKTRQP